MPHTEPRAASTEAGPSLRHTRRSLLLIAGLMLSLFLVASATLVVIAFQQNHAALEHSRQYAARAIDSQLRALETVVSDYAFWGDAYRHLHVTVDTGWAYERQNMGPSLYEDFGYEGLLVIGPDDTTTYAVIRGALTDLSAERWLGQGLDGVLALARAQYEAEEPVSVIHNMNGQPVLVGAAPLTVGSDPTVTPMRGGTSVVLFVSIMSPEKLLQIGRDLGVDGLRVADQGASNERAWLDLDTQGPSIALTWDPARPGEQLLYVMLPLLLLTGILCAGLALAILQRAFNTARDVDASYASLSASQAALAISEARFRDVAEASSDWIWETDSDLQITYLSDRFAKVTGHLRKDWLGRPITDFLRCPANLASWLNGQIGRTPGGDTWQCYYMSRDGRRRVCMVSLRYIEESPLAGGYRGTARDITDEVEARARIEHLSQHDSLTGLPNRNRLQQFLDGRLKDTAAENEPLAMLSIDLDRFKPVNDTFGHHAGDLVLTEVANRLRSCLRDGDLVARLGGDEFILIVSGLATQDEIARLCARLIDSVERVIEYRGQRVFISASIGVAMAPMDATDPAELLRYADIALYEAKGAGRKTWCFYASDMNERILQRNQLERDLRQAIKDQTLHIVMQPRYHVESGRMVAAETLVRWYHPVRGQLGPDLFIPIAEETGLIHPLSTWILRSACEEAVAWKNDVRVSVNLSPSEFRRGDLVARVHDILRETGLEPHRLELEVTENVMLEDAERALEVMLQLKALGVRLAMDDFGTGYSSLSYLSNFPFDGLKIDRAFIAGLGDSASSQAIVEAVIALGSALDLTITAEGVETSEQLEQLRRLGCFEAQGYHLDRPMHLKDLRKMMVPVQSIGESN
ncbi:EAL domain-containing protein [Halopseudomonas nanhaiensis]|uniref:bifunctional diguanylate cyclase/phosphodiesterase n=1 Tax=Halopseudomonas nanhaiensis TaxID=2830842 RepID=UPI001CBBD920|nr:EAL domain-containing protein [Halopseudomonas nanhaiensis]UAW99742.1 EAL domain-containing protein [Halopseudomonas nanhaiensis]